MLNIILVDDEENILNGYRRSLKGLFALSLFTDPFEALTTLTERKDFSVIVSDFKMPGISGLEFLKKAHELAPDSVKILLTGFADLQLVIDAINEGYIYRFLTKPCSSEVLQKTLHLAVNQYRLITAEKELVEKTLKGSIKVLIDILSVANPLVFNRANSMRELAKKLLSRLSIKDTWEIEIAVLLSQIGCVGIPVEVLDKRFKGVSLNNKEEEIFISHADIGFSLLKNIPRLEKISHAISLQFKTHKTIDGIVDVSIESSILFIAKLLRLLNDYFWLTERGIQPKKAMSFLHEESHQYDSMLISALEAEVLGVSDGFVVSTKSFDQLKDGMVLADDLLDQNGYKLLPKGTVISDVYIMKLLNMSKLKTMTNSIKVYSKV